MSRPRWRAESGCWCSTTCEHLRDAAADLVEAILAQSTTVKVLATSREGLGVADEQLWLVPSLDVGAGIDSAAVELFVERAHSVASHFSVATPDEAAAVVEICRRLDGIPLAIELAASRMASMTAIEVRERLDQRFRLLVGSRRGLERHHTLRHAVAWSYDLLDDTEKALLDRCSVFAGGFDLQSACAVAGSDDDFATLDLLDALVRKSLLVADRSSGRTRFAMLETIRQFAEEQLAATGAATEARTAHARYFAGREADILAVWDSPRQRAAYDWFTVELANLRTAFRWAADHGDLDAAATYAILGAVVDNYEPIAWAEELIEPARAVDHPRLATLYVLAAQCWRPGRIVAAVGYADTGQTVIGSGGQVPFGQEGVLGVVYLVIGQPERLAEWCRAQLARGHDTHTFTRAYLVFALAAAGAGEEARTATNGLVDAAEATHNPYVLSFALWTYGYAFRDADPVPALEALRRGLVIAKTAATACSNPIWRPLCLSLSPNTATRWQHSITSLWPPATATTLATSALSVPPWQLSRYSSTASDTSNRRPPSPDSPSTHSPARPCPRSTPRSLTCAKSSASRPTNRSPARARP